MVEQKLDDALACPCDGLPSIETWMEEYFSEQNEKAGAECRTCALSVLVPEYQEELTNSGYPVLADQLATVLESNSTDLFMDVARAIDKAKFHVDNDTRNRLCVLDYEAQIGAQENHTEEPDASKS